MADDTPTRPQTEGEHLDDLSPEALRADDNVLARMVLSAVREVIRTELAKEVRTRRLVVEGPDGTERVVAEGQEDWGHLEVRCKADPDEIGGQTTKVVLYAGEENGRDAQVSLYGSGNGYGGLFLSQLDPDSPCATGGPGHRVSLDLHQVDSDPGIDIDSDGLHLAPVRLYQERQWAAKERSESEARRSARTTSEGG